MFALCHASRDRCVDVHGDTSLMEQAAWRHDGANGYAAYKVADSVRTHEAWGLDSCIFTNVDPSLHATNAFEVLVTPGAGCTT